LLADFSLEANVRRNYEWDVGMLKLLCKFVPRCPLQNDTEVADWYLISVNGVCRDHPGFFGGEMRGNLVAEKVEVDPASALSSDLTAKHLDVELSRQLQVHDWEGEMEPRKGHAFLHKEILFFSLVDSRFDGHLDNRPQVHGDGEARSKDLGVGGMNCRIHILPLC
jgi:hypothetical protein